MSKQKQPSRFKRMLEAKTTTLIALLILVMPFLVFGLIIYRDSSQTGEPVVGDRYENQLDPAITDTQLDTINSSLVDESIISKKVTLKSSTLRIYLEVDAAESKDAIKALANTAYETVAETLPIETYFTLEGSKKMYDLEVHVYNNAEDRDSEEFVYYQIIKSSSLEEIDGEFVSEARDPNFRDEVLEILEEKEKEDAAEKPAEEEDDKGGE